MTGNFAVKKYNNWLRVDKNSNVSFYHYYIYIDNQLAAYYYSGDTFFVQTNQQEPKHVKILASFWDGYYQRVVSEDYLLKSPAKRSRERDFKPGDILVASDNVNQSMTGYMGHSALVVDDKKLIESPGGHPAIRKDTIQQFLDKHPVHAQFRPKSAETGKLAVKYAKDYLKKYKKNLDEGKKKPVFSFNLSQSLEEPWEYIYCSKLIWLSYFHGADYKFKNDYLWYSPEDLYTNLLENDDFELIYEHEDVKFHINT